MNHCNIICHKSHLTPFLSNHACVVHRKYSSIIFNVKKCTLYLIKYINALQIESIVVSCKCSQSYVVIQALLTNIKLG